MKVLRKGDGNENRLWIGHCRICKSLIEAKESELKIEHSRDGHYATSDCPSCKADGTVSFHLKGTQAGDDNL